MTEQVLQTPKIKNGVFTTLGSSLIKGDPDVIFKTLLKFDDYSRWNTFTPNAEKVTSFEDFPKIGDQINLTVHMNGMNTRTQLVEITSFDANLRRICWKGLGFPNWALRSERVQELIEVDPGVYEYKNYETMEGFASYLTNFFVRSQLDEGFQRCTSDLKNYIESTS
ncbi:decapping and exoribonuclease protein [Acrasis kona]|uniref:Decapping and exoribonuclease protein n=1 Tax=Acrasis kona TaxID=1008807 RepID=A0AAW2Z060_9EUKA